MKVRCYICRMDVEVARYEERGEYVMVMCAKGHEQFIRKRDEKKLITRG